MFQGDVKDSPHEQMGDILSYFFLFLQNRGGNSWEICEVYCEAKQTVIAEISKSRYFDCESSLIFSTGFNVSRTPKCCVSCCNISTVL